MSDHSAVNAAGDPYDAPGFDYAAHDRWVADGFCPVVSETRAYCGKRPGHSGQHGSPAQKPSAAQGFDTVWLEWDR
jgi:hypothetical protein